MLTLLLAYRRRISVSILSGIAAPPSLRWGFQTGGTLIANLTDVTSDEVAIALCTKDEVNKIAQYTRMSCDKFVTMCSASGYQDVVGRSANFFLKVPTKDHYYTAFSACVGYISYLNLDLQYSNPDTKLSTDALPCLYAKPVMAVLFGVCLIYWLINWALNCQGSTPVHKVFTAAFFLALITVLVDCGYYAHYNKSDSNNGIDIATIVCGCLFMFITVSCFVLVSNGFGIIHNDYTYKDVGIILLLDAVMIGCIYGYRYTDKFWLGLILLVAFGLSLYFIIRIVMAGTRKCTIQIYAHMYVIAERRIDPLTTPLKKKLTIYKQITTVLTSYMALTLILMVVYSIFGLTEWIYELISDIINLALVVGAMYLFRLERSRGGYSNINSNETEKPQEFTIQDIENMDLTAMLIVGTQKWDGETPLPPMPRIVDTPTHALQDDQEIEVQPSNPYPEDVDIPAPATANGNTYPPPQFNNVAPAQPPANANAYPSPQFNNVTPVINPYNND